VVLAATVIFEDCGIRQLQLGRSRRSFHSGFHLPRAPTFVLTRR
jgi:hypothetical protein